jgi:hypothetical protein
VRVVLSNKSYYLLQLYQVIYVKERLANETTQLVKVKQARNELEETYVKTTFIKEPEPESEVPQTRASKNEDAYDKTGGVRAYSQYPKDSGMKK